MSIPILTTGLPTDAFASKRTSADEQATLMDDKQSDWFAPTSDAVTAVTTRAIDSESTASHGIER